MGTNFIKKNSAIFYRRDIDRLRRQLQIGDVLSEKIEYDRLGERLMVPVMRKVRIIAKYPYLVEVDDGSDSLRRKTITYVDILLQEVVNGQSTL